MANEKSISATLTVSKSGDTISAAYTSTETLTGDGKYSNVQVIGTSAEAISLPGDLTTEGVTWLMLKNLDDTNYIEVALDSGMTNKVTKLAAGQFALLPPYATNPTYYAKANTADCSLQITALGT